MIVFCHENFNIIFHSAYQPGLDTIIDKWSCINHVQDTIPRSIDIQAYNCNSAHNRNVYSGLYEAMATFGGRVLYAKLHPNSNPVYQNYFRWVAENNRWEQKLLHYILQPGYTVWGETVGELDFNTPGKIIYWIISV